MTRFSRVDQRRLSRSERRSFEARDDLLLLRDVLERDCGARCPEDRAAGWRDDGRATVADRRVSTLARGWFAVRRVTTFARGWFVVRRVTTFGRDRFVARGVTTFVRDWFAVRWVTTFVRAWLDVRRATSPGRTFDARAAASRRSRKRISGLSDERWMRGVRFVTPDSLNDRATVGCPVDAREFG